MDALEKAFLKDICDHPDDDAPRLIYADWLEERGNPGDRRTPSDAERAEFIRLQIELARNPQWENTTDDTERRNFFHKKARSATLQKRVDQYYKPYTTWLLSIINYDRGFPHMVEASDHNGDARRKYFKDDVIRPLQALTEVAPIHAASLCVDNQRNYALLLQDEGIQSVRAFRCKSRETLEGLLSSPVGRQMQGLIVNFELNDGAEAAEVTSMLNAIAAADLPNLQTLTVDAHKLADEFSRAQAAAIRNILNSQSLPSLREIRVSPNNLCSKALRRDIERFMEEKNPTPPETDVQGGAEVHGGDLRPPRPAPKRRN